MATRDMNGITFTSAFLLAGFLSHAALAVPPGWPTESPGEERPEGLFTLSEEVVTPHTAWAKPYAQKSPSILFIVPRWSAREVVELAQRLSMKYEAVMVSGHSYASQGGVTDESPRIWPAAERPAKTATRLTDALAKPWDVIVVGNVCFTMGAGLASESIHLERGGV
jgi:hypothetical protein